ncbi:NAD(P)-dependent dehydrogenase (short-subunit alcohol dehydrogenase family) [Arthrobacter sp. PvP102]|uniref:SDR family NAD(P)-dependent oxidoreductase n=1 Tax=unclassified Arthrobacter TaxID=235627 RepID=UPI001AEAD416|nr:MULTISPECIES: SDR family oxidoreductase [unclassified Arthrobacter]MBP1235280.1 NAD(P)-dependent dehydrogenase (short-subunit alcohol dehydrogenase family) [Arthrobacter sp. PvP103]MBP1236239.1 NAD(P)-dependent dehydrogenase (short-subunit alcohol dehydrogenase family) [Arthrobacter sp. PvP102]
MTPTPVAVITGGGTGIGAATAAALRGQGWDVVVCGRRREAIAKVAETTGAHAVVADVASVSDMERLVVDTVKQFGTINGLVLNAGIVRAGSAGELSDGDWNAMVNTNLTGPFFLVRAALPHLIRSNGSIVGVASAAALRATAGIAGYDATKAGLAMLMQSVAVDYGPLGVRANAVCPGWTRTEMADMEMGEFAEHRGIDREEAYSLATAFVPSRRPAASSEVADVIAWLLSDQASYVNAATIPVDGGLIAVEPGAIAFDPRVRIGTNPVEGPTPVMQATP